MEWNQVWEDRTKYMYTKMAVLAGLTPAVAMKLIVGNIRGISRKNEEKNPNA
jgi:hypothetical protein